MPTGLLQSENLHPLEESTRRLASKRLKTSDHWRNWYVGRLPSIQIHPLTGTILPPTGLPAEQNTQWVEQSAR